MLRFTHRNAQVKRHDPAMSHCPLLSLSRCSPAQTCPSPSDLWPVSLHCQQLASSSYTTSTLLQVAKKRKHKPANNEEQSGKRARQQQQGEAPAQLASQVGDARACQVVAPGAPMLTTGCLGSFLPSLSLFE